MSEPVVCVKCNATSYNDPGKTRLYCHGCFTKLKEREEELTLALKAASAKNLAASRRYGALWNLESDFQAKINSLIGPPPYNEEN